MIISDLEKSNVTFNELEKSLTEEGNFLFLHHCQVVRSNGNSNGIITLSFPGYI